MTSRANAATGADEAQKAARGASGDTRPAAPPVTGAAEPLGGDPACWLNRVCDACGRFIDDETALTCPVCGAAR